MMYEIIYVPRVEDEIAVARYSTREEAEQHMKYVRNRQPKVFDYHYIKEIEEDDRGEVFADDIEDEVQKNFGYENRKNSKQKDDIEMFDDMKKMLFKDFDKVDKFGIQLLVAFSFGIGVITLGWVMSANAEPQWVSNQCNVGHQRKLMD